MPSDTPVCSVCGGERRVAAGRVDATDPPSRAPQEGEAAVMSPLSSDERSFGYVLRFYRQLAGRVGFDGSKPEAAANWVYRNIQDLAARADYAEKTIWEMTGGKAGGQ